MTNIVLGAFRGAAVGLAVSIATISFVAGPDSVWDWPAHSRGMAAMLSVFICAFTAAAGAALSEKYHD